MPSEADKRIMVIHLTDKGKAGQAVESDYSSIFNCLNDDELTQFSTYLHRITGLLAQQVYDRPNDDVRNNWMQNARTRMGAERFNELVAMRARGFDSHPAAGFHGGFGTVRREPPEGMWDVERFRLDSNEDVDTADKDKKE